MDLSKLKLSEQPGTDVVRLTVKAVPGASRTRIVGELGGALKIAVAAAPERGQANRAIVELLAASLGVREANIGITRGQASALKELTIHGLSASDLLARLGNSGA